MVRLKDTHAMVSDIQMSFQFHYGTIKSIRGIYVLAYVSDFNSTMVRLKVMSYLGYGQPNLFQFHYGTIKRYLGGHSSTVSVKFQFHYGTIKRNGTHYNSYGEIIFQFHYGTIKRHCFVWSN